MTKKPSIAIIGLGITGSSIAAHLSGQGYSVSGFEQFEVAHDQGSSHGENRLFRRVPGEGEKYVEMAARAAALWPIIEKKSGCKLFSANGCMDIAAEGEDWAERSFKLAQDYGVKAERLSVNQAAEKLPVFDFQNGMEITWVPESGILKAEESLLAFQHIARDNGANLQFNCRILDLDKAAKTITAENAGTQKFDIIIISAGAWVKKFAGQVEAVIEKSVLGWYGADIGTSTLPGFSFKNGDKGFYGMPGLDGKSFKIGPARQHNVLENLEPKQDIFENDRAVLNACITNFTKRLNVSDARFDSGKITHLPDGEFLFTRHKDNADILIFSPCSGHGFKYAPVYGEIAEEMIKA